jgi:glycosyltransferase involved in cell wall biosynthesis
VAVNTHKRLRQMITIGIPFYNSAVTLERAIRSVFAQAYPSWELLLVDDGSTDDSLSVARAVRDPRVRVISDSLRQGLSPRLNQIAQLAAGEYIARMDADDIMHPERLGRQLEFLQAHPEVDVVSCGAYVIDDADRPWGRTDRTLVPLTPYRLLSRPNVLHPSVMGKTQWFRQHEYDPSYFRSEDRELWCRTRHSSTIYRMPELLMFYRQPLKVNLDSYLLGTANVLRILGRYGTAMAGRSRSLAVAASLSIRALCYCLAPSVGLVSTLVKQRYPSLSNEEKDEAAAVLRDIVSMPVAGL